MALPQTASKKRVDPSPRPVVGVPDAFTAERDIVQNKRPDRHYVLVHCGSGNGMEDICPASYSHAGYSVEKWEDHEKNPSALRFRNCAFGQPGTDMLYRGNVLMSISIDLLQQTVAEQQALADEMQSRVDSRSVAIAEARQQLAKQRISPDYMSVTSLADHE